MAKIAFLFPGQGAQTVGMAGAVTESVPEAKSLFDRAGEVLGYDLLNLCVEGPVDRLNATDVSQPALFVAGLAAVEKLRRESPEVVAGCSAAAGLSLGEYTALVFAGALDFEAGLRVVEARGKAMQAAADANPGAMLSVLGLEEDKVVELCKRASAAGPVWLANHLCPNNLVVSGSRAGCEEVERLAPDAGAMSTIRLAVVGAFHTALMKPADEQLAKALAGVTIRSPRLPVVSNVDARPHVDADEIKKLLVRQVLEPVQWERSMRYLLAEGYDTFYELGPGRVLAGLMKRIQRKTNFVNVG